MAGADRLLAALEAAAEEATDRNVHKAAAELVAATARPLTPRGPTSKLRRSIRASGTKGSSVVRAGGPAVPWAGPVHFGHLNRPQGGYVVANPFLYKAGDRRADEVVDLFARRFDTALRRQGLT